MAKSAETKLQFIELRAEGLSFAKCAERLHVAKSTLQEWDRELAAEIQERRDEREEEVYSLYGLSREARLRRMGEMLGRINAALEEKDLSEMSADRLLTMKLQYEKALKEDYKEPATVLLPLFEEESLLSATRALLDAQLHGDIDPKNAKQHLETLKFLLTQRQAIDDSDPFNFSVRDIGTDI